MSRQSKNARKMELARQFSAARQAGNKGPSQTTPKHGKRVTFRSNPANQPRTYPGQRSSAQQGRGKPSFGNAAR